MIGVRVGARAAGANAEQTQNTVAAIAHAMRGLGSEPYMVGDKAAGGGDEAAGGFDGYGTGGGTGTAGGALYGGGDGLFCCLWQTRTANKQQTKYKSNT